jgi:hypothetical protein
MTPADPQSLCPTCGAANRCAIAAGLAAAECWCMSAPLARPLPTDPAARCHCAGCLAGNPAGPNDRAAGSAI